MSNLSQNQIAAKVAFLNKQLEETLKAFKSASRSERSAAIKHVDGFLETLDDEQKLFWLRFREKLERMNEFALPMRPNPFISEKIQYFCNRHKVGSNQSFKNLHFRLYLTQI